VCFDFSFVCFFVPSLSWQIILFNGK
jgi:hypothetical protein